MYSGAWAGRSEQGAADQDVQSKGPCSSGKLENARIVESLTALLFGLNMRYKVHGAGIRFTGLPLKRFLLGVVAVFESDTDKSQKRPECHHHRPLHPVKCFDFSHYNCAIAWTVICTHSRGFVWGGEEHG
jgi:hypothetical protein